jgi:hypothetical protein
MKFKEVINRLTGISTPVFGVSWSPPDIEVTKARRVIRFLEDRRVLYNPSEMETPDYCVQSVLEIRRFLTQELNSLDEDSELSQGLRAMQAACRKFLDTVEQDDRRIITFGAHRGHYARWIFMSALGEMRGVFGIQIAKLAAQHGLDIEDELARTLPISDGGERD